MKAGNLDDTCVLVHQELAHKPPEMPVFFALSDTSDKGEL